MSIFRKGSWSFGRQGQRNSDGDRNHRSLIEEESFDMGSNLGLPVYMSRQEAGEWMYPLDENGQPVEIIDDSHHEEDDDDKFSDVASSIVSTSTVAESREFWLNCLKENGVDMTTSLPHSSPRKPFSLSTKGSVTPPRSVDPLALHDDNSVRSYNDECSSIDTGKQPSSTSSASSIPFDKLQKKFSTESSLIWEDLSTTKVGQQSVETSDVDSLEADKKDFNKIETLSLEAKQTSSTVSEANVQKSPEKQPTIPFPVDNVSEVVVNSSTTKEIIQKWKGGPAPFDDYSTTKEKDQNLTISSRVQVFTVTSQDTADSWNEHNETHPTYSKVQVTTVTSEESCDAVLTQTKNNLAYCSSNDSDIPKGVDDLLSNSLDHSPFVDDSMDISDMERRWIPPKYTEVESEHAKEKGAPNEASTVKPIRVNRPESNSKDTVTAKEVVAPTVGVTTNSAQGGFSPKDPYTWMYKVWHRNGLMKMPGHSRESLLRIDVVLNSVDENRTTPKSVSAVQLPDTIRTKNGEKSQDEPLETPREAFVTLDYKALRANGEDIPSRARRSLPANVRSSAQKEGGRKSFENIMKMWRNKSDDRPNSFFSPEHYMDDRVRSHDSSKSKPTQHSQLMSIAQRTAMFERETTTSTKPEENAARATPRPAARHESSSQTKYTPGSSSSNKSPYPLFSPARESTIDDQLQRPPKRLSSGKRRKSQPMPSMNRSSEKEITSNSRRRETINPKEHFRRHIAPGRSLCDYKSMVKNDYKSVVRTFLASVEEHKELEEPKKDDLSSNLSGIDSIPQDSMEELAPQESIEEMTEFDMISPRNADISENVPLSAQRSASKDSPWTQQVVRQLEEVPVGSGERRSSWREDRPWREDVFKRRVSGFSDSSVASATDDGPCQCSSSVFSGNDELIEFFLPQMGMACNCGKRAMGLQTPEEPTSLENILRPWQVRFLAAFGIHRGDQLVKAHHRSAKAMANALRQYRRKHGMTPFRTKSCGMALQIWSKTCKAYVRSIRKQLTNGTSDLKVPNTLYIISSFLEKMHEMHSPMPRNPNTVHEDEASV
eukprot:scaffold1087_cov154-Amphora_coffeaeformis.AAC.4